MQGRSNPEGLETRTAPWLWPRAAYLHVPFCAHHCCYCDFAVVAGQDELAGRYLDALECELAALGEPQSVDTLFLGGGTPTHLAPVQLERLLIAIKRWLPANVGHEFTVEANPASLTEDKIAMLADHGVNRVSLGAQSFHPQVLRVLERDHGADDIRRVVGTVRRRIGNVSLDLIFGVPGQSLAQWAADLRGALDLGIDHVSTYGLTYEKGTRLWKDRQRGWVTPIDEETELAMYLHAMDGLEAAGLEQYEISSFARPGRRCRHNQVYWANHAYFGFGLGAARYVNLCREVTTRDFQSYLRKALAGQSTVAQREMLDQEERARETLTLNLRRAEGIDRPAFRDQTGCDVDALVGPVIALHHEAGLLQDDGKRVWLTRQGKCVADAVAGSLM
jgi:oxygen-independent coproporphyrinogen-3 oxidase